ncbi:MAG TPA: NAD(P)-binding protein [Polyangiaceae bacterium]|nr:NAD(P)-binding protein [Polyangiaceae bacterium]
MKPKIFETDYLVIGSGATGLAFTDALIEHCNARVIVVDRRHAPGGHWNDVYPFVRLHHPSAYYGVNSLSLGGDSIDQHGLNRGLYERATGPEVCAYYSRVMHERLLGSGRVQYFPMCDYQGGERFVSRISGDRYEVKVRKARVDAGYLEPAIPATTKPPFEVVPDARCVPPNELPGLVERADGYVIIGAGKTAIDACLWLLELGVPASDIRWIKPRECWLQNRAFAQGGELVGWMLEGISLQVEAAALASSVEDLFARLSDSAQLLRADTSVTPTMFKAATASSAELDELRRIENVVRLGRVRRIERDAIVLEGGSIPTNGRQLHVHCAAAGLNPAPTMPIFGEGVITPQPIRTGLIPFNAALVGFVEASARDLVEKNRLCPPNRLPDVPLDWLRGTLIGRTADYLWSKEPDISAWLDRSRLNPSRGLDQHSQDPGVQRASQRFLKHVRPALENLKRLLAAA